MSDRPLLVLFVALPGSGKTTFARQLADKIGAVTLNSDATRLAIWGSREAVRASRPTPELRVRNNEMTFGAMQYASRQILKSGHSVIYDANMSRVQDRSQLVTFAYEYGAQPIIIRMKTPQVVSLQRLQQREEHDDQMKHDTAKAKATLDRFVAELEEATEAEQAIEISGEVPFDEQYAGFQVGLEKMLHESTRKY